MKNRYEAPAIEKDSFVLESLLGTASLSILEGETGTNNGGEDETTGNGFKGLSRQDYDIWEDEEEEAY